MSQQFVVSCMAWSTDGRYLSVGSSQNKQLRLLQLDKTSQENILTLKDSLKRDPNFWIKYPIDLRQHTPIETSTKVPAPVQRANLNDSHSETDITETVRATDLKILEELKKTQTKMMESKLIQAP